MTIDELGTLAEELGVQSEDLASAVTAEIRYVLTCAWGGCAKEVYDDERSRHELAAQAIEEGWIAVDGVPYCSLVCAEEEGGQTYMREVINLDHIVRAARSDPNGGKTAGELYYDVWLTDGARLRVSCDNYENDDDPFVLLERVLEGGRVSLHGHLFDWTMPA